MFWKRLTEVADNDRILKNIEKGEQKIQRTKDIKKAITRKLDKYKNPARTRGAAPCPWRSAPRASGVL